MFEILEDNNEDMGNAKIKVIGIGGGGCNAVNTMIRSGLSGIEYVVVNTDAQALNASLAASKIQLGADITKGLGAGANPEVARKAAIDEGERLSDIINGSDMIFVTAGMGGGTGTGAAPIIANLARELGALTVGVITKPFIFEGKKRMRQACQGVKELESCVDSLITIPNQKLLQLAGENLSLVETFKKADEILLNAVQGISDLINNTGLINADFADVRTVMANKGMALMGTGICSGPDRAIKAASEAICSPLLEDISIDGATGIIVNISGDQSLTTHEANEAMTFIMEAADDDAEIIFGTVIDESLSDSVKITVIATGLGGKEKVTNNREDSKQHEFDEEKADYVMKEAIELEPAKEPLVSENEKVFQEIEDRIENNFLKFEDMSLDKDNNQDHVERKPEEITSRDDSFKNKINVHDDVQVNRAKSIAERLGFINFKEDELDTPSYLRKDQ